MLPVPYPAGAVGHPGIEPKEGTHSPPTFPLPVGSSAPLPVSQPREERRWKDGKEGGRERCTAAAPSTCGF